jgi:hypothetical protein
MGPAAQGGLTVLSRQSLTGSRQTVAFFWDDVAIDIPQRGRMGEDSRDIIGERTRESLFAECGSWFIDGGYILLRLTRCDHETHGCRGIAIVIIINITPQEKRHELE